MTFSDVFGRSRSTTSLSTDLHEELKLDWTSREL
jgi:hypothetical protein